MRKKFFFWHIEARHANFGEVVAPEVVTGAITEEASIEFLSPQPWHAALVVKSLATGTRL